MRALAFNAYKPHKLLGSWIVPQFNYCSPLDAIYTRCVLYPAAFLN